MLGYAAYRVLRYAAGAVLDRWWYAELTDAPVWSRRFGAQLTLILVAGLVSLAVMLVSNRCALATTGPSDQKTFRPIALANTRLGPAVGWLAVLLPVWFGLHIAGAAGGYWQQWLLFRSSRGLGRTAPEVGYDLSYHLFRLPFLSTATAWLMSLLAVTLVMAWVIFVLRGAVRLPFGGRRSSPRAIAHLALLGAALLVVRAVDYWFVKYPSLASRPEGRFHGAGWAVMHGAGVAYRPLAAASLAGAIALALFAARRIRPVWPAATITTLLACHVVLVALLPIALQRVVVAPAEAEREQPYIALNLAATKQAYALDGMATSTRELDDAAPPAEHADRVPLFDTDQLAAAFQILQGSRGTRVRHVDLDRYAREGALAPTAVAARDVALSELPEHGWVQEHLVYTHGDGVVTARAEAAGRGGVIEFVDPGAEFGLAEPQTYFGEGAGGWYVFTGTKRAEAGGAEFSGTTGVRVGSTWRRLVAAVALGDYNVAATSEFTSGTQLLYRRSIAERVGALAPFLTLDSDPYPVITGGRVVWAVDAYTTAHTYPYAQFADATGVPAASDIRSANYVRRAALVTIDGYDGTVHVYRADSGTDPVLSLWADIMPGLLEDPAGIPDEIAAHRRFGDDLFTVQTNMVAAYHVDDAETLFSGTDSWIVSPAAGSAAEDTGTGPAPAVTLFDGDSPDANWSEYRAFSPGAVGNPASTRDEMTAVAIGDHTTGDVEIVRLRRRDGEQVTSPRVAQSLIAADPEVSQLFTLLNANGSKVLFGPMTPVLSDTSLAWIRPVFVVGTTGTATPRLYSVLAVVDGEVGMGATAGAALADVGQG